MKCPFCNGSRIREIISAGITQTVLWDGDFIIQEITQYDTTDKHSRYICDNCLADLTDV